MKMKVQLVVYAEDGREEEVHEIAVVEKPHERIEHLGFTLAEAKAILKRLQRQLVERQATAFVAAQAQCDSCGKAPGITAYHTRTFRTLFGIMTLTSPRFYHGRCQRRKTTTFRPLNGIVKLTAERKNCFHSAGISSGSEGLTSHLGIYNGLEMSSTPHSTTPLCRFHR
jgi:hypothetical protein